MDEIKVNHRSQGGGPRVGRRRVGFKWRVIIAILVLLVAAAGTFAVLQWRENERLKDPEYMSAQAQRDADALVAKVSKLMLLPDESPTIATVKDADKLRASEVFFRDVKNGDKILIFAAAQTAVIYRESDNRIIKSGPIVMSNPETDTDAATPAE